MFKSGLLYDYGYGFWGANGHDGLWHIALSENLIKGTLESPVFAGYKIQNYHIGFDILLSLLHKITLIPTANLYFQILPVILSFAIGFATYKFIETWTNSKSSAIWSTFFVYFGGSFGYLLNKGESAFWSQQSISTLINPPFALSLLIILIGLVCLKRYEQKDNLFNYILVVVLLGSLSAVKIYASILVIFALLAAALLKFLKDKNLNFVYVFVGVVVVSFLIYLPLNSGSQNIIVWQPFWFLETMMSTSDRVGWDKYYSAMNTYKSGHVWLKAFIAYFIAFGLFMVGNMGTRIVSFVKYFKWLIKYKKISWTETFLTTVFVIGVAIPMVFVQKGTPWNTVQFFYYSLFVSSLVSGLVIDEWLKVISKNKYKFVFATVLFLATIPTTLISLKDVYVPKRPPAMLSKNEIEALEFLASQPQGVVLTYPFDEMQSKKAENSPPRPLYLYVSTSYVSAFSKQTTFLEDEINLNITGYDWQSRKKLLLEWYKTSDMVFARKFLVENNIKYVYWVKGQRALLGEGQLGLKNIFENKEVTIYKVE